MEADLRHRFAAANHSWPCRNAAPWTVQRPAIVSGRIIEARMKSLILLLAFAASAYAIIDCLPTHFQREYVYAKGHAKVTRPGQPDVRKKLRIDLVTSGKFFLAVFARFRNILPNS